LISEIQGKQKINRGFKRETFDFEIENEILDYHARIQALFIRKVEK
jgi:hypothetical protein